MEVTKSEYIEVSADVIHGTGILAKKFIPKGTKIIEYVGEKITKDEAEKRINVIDEKVEKEGKPSEYYVFEFDDKYDIDGDVPYNTARFINHSCDPNCETEDVDGGIWIMAMRDIQPGEELTYDYGFEFDEEDYEDHPCHCGSDRCVGHIVSQDDWSKLAKVLKKKKK